LLPRVITLLEGESLVNGDALAAHQRGAGVKSIVALAAASS
jgi:hypothetical protein